MSRMVPLQSRIDTPRPMPAIQRASDATGPALEAASRFGAVPPIVNEVLSTPGKALDPVTREMMGTRLGHDFGKVRVHADSRAAASAKAPMPRLTRWPRSWCSTKEGMRRTAPKGGKCWRMSSSIRSSRAIMVLERRTSRLEIRQLEARRKPIRR